jgi:hypothetical protein
MEENNLQKQETLKPETPPLSEPLGAQTLIATEPKKKSPIIMMFLVCIALIAIGVAGYFGYENYLLVSQKTIIPPPPDLPIKPTNITITTQSIKDTKTQQTITCEVAQEKYLTGSGYKDVKVTIIKDTTPGYCKLTHINGEYTVLFKDGWITTQSGAWGQTVAFTKGSINQESNDYPKNTIYLSETGLDSKSTLDVSQIDKIIITGGGVAPLIGPYEKIISKTSKTIGEKNILELTTTFTNNTSGSPYEFDRTFYIINNLKRVIYSFRIAANNSNFTNPEDKERITLIEQMIASMKY